MRGILTVLLTGGCAAVLSSGSYSRAVSATDTLHLVGVSGGLQDGFPARHWLDFHPGEADENKAVFVGHALVRGYKAYLDVKQPGWREYTEEPGKPLINPVVIPSGCDEHANIYAIYAVDDRQALKALLSEPRFLSMTPDTGLVDLKAEETDESVRTLVRRQALSEGKTDLDKAAFLIVTGVWSPVSLIESPVLYTKEDGTQVTDFPRSLAAWAGTTDSARLGIDSDGDTPDNYWASVHHAVRKAQNKEVPPLSPRESSPSSLVDKTSAAPSLTVARPLHACTSQARYGSGPNTVRMGGEYTRDQLMSTVPEVFPGVEEGGKETGRENEACNARV